jgi:hypothetical protein
MQYSVNFGVKKEQKTKKFRSYFELTIIAPVGSIHQ